MITYTGNQVEAINDSFNDRIHKLEKTITEREGDLAQAEGDLDEARKQIAALTASLAEREKDNLILNKENRISHEKLDIVRANLQGRIGDLCNRIDELTAQLAEHEWISPVQAMKSVKYQCWHNIGIVTIGRFSSALDSWLDADSRVMSVPILIKPIHLPSASPTKAPFEKIVEAKEGARKNPAFRKNPVSGLPMKLYRIGNGNPATKAESEQPYPQIICPQCGHEFDDMDGFGFIFCKKCKHCTHPSAYEGHCGICGIPVERIG